MRPPSISENSVHGASSGADPRLHPESEYDHADAMSFVREATCLAKMAVAHESIVGYLGHGFVRTPDGLAGFLVMEFVDGQDMYDAVIRRKRRASPLPLASIAKWSIQLSSAVAHLHAHGIVHRDVKETNVVFNGRGELSSAVLIDLGLAMLLPSSHAHGACGLLPFRQMFGVNGYRAPEVQRRQSYGPAVDIFALGRVIYNMLKCFAPAPAASVSFAAVVSRVRPASCWAYEALYCTPPVSYLWPAPFREIVLRCLAADPKNRPSSRELTEQLSKLAPQYVAAPHLL